MCAIDQHNLAHNVIAEENRQRLSNVFERRKIENVGTELVVFQKTKINQLSSDVT